MSLQIDNQQEWFLVRWVQVAELPTSAKVAFVHLCKEAVTIDNLGLAPSGVTDHKHAA